MNAIIWIAAAAERLLADDDAFAAMRRHRTAMAGGGEAGAHAYLDLCRLVGEAGDPAAVMIAADEAPADAAGTLGGLILHVFAAIRVDYAAQQDAAAARVAVSDRASAAYEAIGPALGHACLDLAMRLAGEASMQLSQVAASRAPLVRVETGISLPASLLAWRLYGDPARAGEIAARNGIGTTMLMPTAFEALGS